MPENIRVLVVDDEPLARMRIEDLLAHEEGTVVVGSATNGIEAVERVGMAEVPLPYAKELEHAAMPNEDRIAAAVRATAGRTP